MSGKDWDKDRIVEDWTGGFSVPDWETDSKACHGCNVALWNKRSHHCRLDGFIYCAKCTVKLHVPARFERKKKDVSRVCMGCREKCLIRRQIYQGDALIPRRAGLVETVDGDVVKIHLPECYADPDTCPTCASCGRTFSKTSHQINCAVCGDVVCTSCHSIECKLPEDFRKSCPSDEKGVCKSCRFRIISGAELIFTPMKPSEKFIGIRGAKREIREKRTSVSKKESSVYRTIGVAAAESRDSISESSVFHKTTSRLDMACKTSE